MSEEEKEENDPMDYYGQMVILNQDTVKNEVNEMLKMKKLGNRIEAIRKRDGVWEWAIENCYGELEWFNIYQACKPVEDYLKSLDTISE